VCGRDPGDGRARQRLVVIISSIGGLRGSPVLGAYGISKAADFSLCRSLAGEWARRACVSIAWRPA